jgi:LAO/AO transport system kinase
VLELAEIVVVNKADGKHINEARAAARELRNALSLIYPHYALWTPPVLTMSALENTGVDEYWQAIVKHRDVLTEAGEFERRRARQQVNWTWQMVQETILSRLESDPEVRRVRTDAERAILDGTLTPALAAEQIVAAAGG